MSIFNQYDPLEKLYVPSGWYIKKNHLFDVNPSILLNISDEKEYFWTKDLFFNADIFIGAHERVLPYLPLICVVSVSCYLYEDLTIIYTVDFSIFYKPSKMSTSIYNEEFKTNDRFDMVKKTSDYMKLYSHYLHPRFEDKTLNKKSNISEYIDSIKC